MNLQERAVQELVDRDPEGAAERILALAMKVSGARAISVFAFVDRRTRLIKSVGLDEDDLERVRALTGELRQRLERGVHVDAREATSLPLMRPGTQELVGVLYIRGATNQAAVAATMAPISSMLAAAVVAVVEPRVLNTTVQHYLTNQSEEDIDRDKLVLALVQCRYNVSQTAARLGVTRATVYKRMIRHGIPRDKVKQGRPFKELGEAE